MPGRRTHKRSNHPADFAAPPLNTISTGYPFHVSQLQQMLYPGAAQNGMFQYVSQTPPVRYVFTQRNYSSAFGNVPVDHPQGNRTTFSSRNQMDRMGHERSRGMMVNQNPFQEQNSVPVTAVANSKVSICNEEGVWTKKNLYAMVKAFVDDPNAEEMSFPPTLSAAERHMVHEIALNFNLHHRSAGCKSERVLTLKKIGSIKNQEKDRENAAFNGDRVKTIDGYQGAQRLPDEYIKSRMNEISLLLGPFLRKMYSQLKATAAKPLRNRHLVVVQPGLMKAPQGNTQHQRYRELQEFRRSLPSYKRRDEIINALKQNNVLIVSGDTGCGKTTQIPQILYDSEVFQKDLEIICTQPRRISALSVAQRVAEERGETCGNSCGYIIRFDNMTSPSTKIVYMTTGILLRRLHTDPQLNGVSCIIVDEVHERDVETDFCLLLLRDRLIEQQRNNQLYKNHVKVVVMSATVQIEKVASYFVCVCGGRAPPIISIPGTLFPVEECFLEEALKWTHLPPSAVPAISMLANVSEKKSKNGNSEDRNDGSIFEKIKATVFGETDNDPEVLVPYDLVFKLISYIHASSHDLSESILIFLPGWASISRVNTMIQRSPIARELSVLQLHSSLTAAEQQRVFYRPPKRFRKVVLSTNIAEASVTIDDIVYVIDSCLTKGTSYDARGNTSVLKATFISKANGMQRRGRAGRCRAGVCVHLLPRSAYEKLPEFLLPEIMRSPLEDVCLQVKALKPDEVCAKVLSRAMDPPPADSTEHAVRFLKDMGAFTSEKEQMTNLGRALSKLPIHPLLGKMLLAAACLGVLEPVVTIAAYLSGKSPFIKPLPHQKNAMRNAVQSIDNGLLSDHLSVMKLFDEWKKSNCSADYAMQNFADQTVLRSMDRIRKQLLRLVKDSSLLRKVEDPMRMASRHSSNLGLVRLVALWSLYPRIASVEYRANRSRKRPEIFCWDNKVAQCAMGSALAFKNRDDFRDRAFVFYHERMYLEANLTVFDASAVTPVEVALCLREFALRPLTDVPPAFLTDDESKMAPAFPFVLEREEEAKDLAVLFFDGDKKLYVTSLPVGLLLRDVRECMDYYLALSIKEVRADLFPEDLIRVLAYVVGYPFSDEVSAIDNNTSDKPVVTYGEEESLEPTTIDCRSAQLNDISDDEDDAPEIFMEDFEDLQMTEEEIQRAIDVFGELAILNRQGGLRLLGAFEKGVQLRQVEADLSRGPEGDFFSEEREQKLRNEDAKKSDECDDEEDEDDDIIIAKAGELDIDDNEY
ncbi:putative ATP-dependent DEAD/H RNA helicase [Trypanosoma cruzi]|uniref:RNA helicase n=2 Tax=Trypanosoma cruzi TaxID=5693 RepID=Q4DQ37_TRYCC|nr:ATP-dependent DEAD/H RNA helicase, putative [Trypanosoma cruzi]EAN94644.1 ATP-dependent DEAD/H RNA helicase, putative [Trypanosoma cruzi]PWV08225.1 putative ATP-dependent DEAD/H RNA helicase [Trypanosoma cruzi]RNC49559.1 putative Atp-dependent DEAD/H RNA helicase [Trypanosoma cruzi]|eukprot:XP_816495.1 ATP-dependent DEAD/H RNA helicase [Trypanosoma cruzi strain CL Brener]